MKRDFEIVKLHFSGPLHLSRGKSDYASSLEVLHSDTLKSALFAAAIMTGQDVVSGQASANGNCQNDFLDSFTVSSAFPFYGNEYFFPKPKCDIQEVLESGQKDRKGKKDIAFLGQSFFEEIIGGSRPFSKKIEKERHVNQIEVLGKPHFGKFASERMGKFAGEDSNFFIVSEDNVMMRVVVPRHAENEKHNPRPYYVERMFFHKNAGMFFFIEMDEKRRPTIRQEIGHALEMLSESGIGTDRNVGNGQFEFSFSTLTLDLPDAATASHQLLLSLCCPSKEEAAAIASGNSAYSLVKRGGYISSPEDEGRFMAFRKKSVYMLEEGSILPAGKINGVLHDLKPETPEDFPEDEKIKHPVWRDGRAFTLPINPIWND